RGPDQADAAHRRAGGRARAVPAFRVAAGPGGAAARPEVAGPAVLAAVPDADPAERAAGRQGGYLPVAGLPAGHHPRPAPGAGRRAAALVGGRARLPAA